MTVVPYKYLAKYYDKIMPEKWYQLYFNFIKKCIVRAGIKPHLIIDAACGTGRLSVKLQNLAPVIGFDRSLEMIKVGRRSSKEIKFFVADLQNFSLSKNQFADVIVCIFDSLNYISSYSALRRVFQNFSSVLSPGGLLIFDINGEKTFIKANFFKYNERKFIFGKNFIVWRNYFYPMKWRVEFKFYIYITNRFNRQNIHREIHEEYWYSPARITKLLTDAHLYVEGLYRDRAFHRPLSKNKRYFFVVRKSKTAI
jgi:SAM-dependent methyltransferase